MPLGFADAMTALLYQISFDPYDPNWINRDRIVLSCGHGSALWYSVLFGLGILTKSDLDNFRQIDSKTPGHPEIGTGIDISTGPLGMGFSWAIGMALAERILNTKTDAIDHHTFVICSDGDLMEGVSYEAAALAGQYKLQKIVALWDNNEITIDGPTNLSRNEDMKTRFLAANWEFLECDGHNIEEVENAIKVAKMAEKPTLISVRTKIGRHSEMENSSKVHGAPLGPEFLAKLEEKLQVDFSAFLAEFENIKQQIRQKKLTWDSKFKYSEEKITNLSNGLKINYSSELKLTKSASLAEKLRPDYATRKHSLTILETLLTENDNLIIASADLASSCYSAPKSGKNISAKDYSGNLLPCGIRENGMVAMTGGITLHGGLRAISSTFLTFYDYARPAVRLAAIMKTPLIMIATHDSICVGEDGPTHQPIEHLDSFRCMPNLLVAPPADGFETEYCYQKAISHDGPSLLVFSRQNLKTIHKNFVFSPADFIFYPENYQNGYIIASGSEVELALEISQNSQNNETKFATDFKNLKNDKITENLTIPILTNPYSPHNCTKIQNCTDSQNQEKFENNYNPNSEKTLQNTRKCVISLPILSENEISELKIDQTKPIDIVEASSAKIWNYFFHNAKIHNIQTFGKSGKESELLKFFNFTKIAIENKIFGPK